MLESTRGRNLTIAILKDVAKPFAIVIISSHTHYPTRVNVHTPARIPLVDALSPNATLGNRIWPDTSAPTANTSLRMKQSDVKFLIPSIRMRFASHLSRPSMEFKVTSLLFHLMLSFAHFRQFCLVAYAVIPLSAESVTRMTQRSGLSLQQLLTDRNLALAPDPAGSSSDPNGTTSQSSAVEETSDSSLDDPTLNGEYPFPLFSFVT